MNAPNDMASARLSNSAGRLGERLRFTARTLENHKGSQSAANPREVNITLFMKIVAYRGERDIQDHNLPEILWKGVAKRGGGSSPRDPKIRRSRQKARADRAFRLEAAEAGRHQGQQHRGLIGRHWDQSTRRFPFLQVFVYRVPIK